MTTSANDSGSSSWAWWAIGAGAGFVVLRVLVQLMSDVFSVNGLLYSIGLGTAEEIAYPLVTRLVTWFGLLELCALAGVAGNYWAGRWKDHWAKNLLLGHVTFCGWIFRGLRAGGRGVWSAASWARARGGGARVEVLMPMDGDDFDALLIESEVA